MHILLVEDHHDTRRALATLLRYSNHEVVAVMSACEALEAVNAHAFDCALIDLGLPDSPGTELMEQLHRRGLTKGIALTGRTSPADVARCREAGFCMHLPKPVTIDELDAALTQIA
jgi:CheY-like chemotaxis protein